MRPLTSPLIARSLQPVPSGQYCYGYSYQYRSSATIGGWPLVHICAGADPKTGRPHVASGVIAVGNIAVGVVAIGGLACGLITAGGCSIGVLVAIGGAALGLGVSTGGLAIGSIALGAVAVGFSYAIGAVAIGPAVISAVKCDAAVVDFARRWLSTISVPPRCGT